LITDFYAHAPPDMRLFRGETEFAFQQFLHPGRALGQNLIFEPPHVGCYRNQNCGRTCSRSAETHSAVSPICNRQGVAAGWSILSVGGSAGCKPAIQHDSILRYGGCGASRVGSIGVHPWLNFFAPPRLCIETRSCGSCVSRFVSSAFADTTHDHRFPRFNRDKMTVQTWRPTRRETAGNEI
jgi:hypothetical protein